MRRTRRAAAIGPVLRRSWAIWVLPLLMAWMLFTADGAPPAADGYWVAATAAGTYLALFVAVGCAICGAWEGFRGQALEDAVGTPARSPARIMFGACWPVGALAVVAVGFGLWLYLPASGTPGTPGFRILAVELLLLAAYAAVGYVLGRAFPVVVAVPLAAVGSFLVAAMPASMEPLWIRHLVASTMDTCCSIDQVPAWEALVAPALFGGGVLASVLMGLAVRHRGWRVLAVGPVVVGAIAASYVAQPLGWNPTTARPMSEADCTGTAPSVCTWPEQERWSTAIREWSADAFDHLDDVGLVNGQNVGPITFSQASPGEDGVIMEIASRLITDDVEACRGGMSERYFTMSDDVTAWLYLIMGLSDSEAEGAVRPQSLAYARAVRTDLSVDEQRRWFEDALAAVADCGSPLPADTPVPSAAPAENQGTRR